MCSNLMLRLLLLTQPSVLLLSATGSHSSAAVAGCLLGSSRLVHALEQDNAAKIDTDTDHQRA